MSWPDTSLFTATAKVSRRTVRCRQLKGLTRLCFVEGQIGVGLGVQCFGPVLRLQRAGALTGGTGGGHRGGVYGSRNKVEDKRVSQSCLHSNTSQINVTCWDAKGVGKYPVRTPLYMQPILVTESAAILLCRSWLRIDRCFESKLGITQVVATSDNDPG
jgi:hypothetical protein